MSVSFPLSVRLPNATRAVQHCSTVDAAESVVYELLRAGTTPVEVHYHRRLLLTFHRDDVPAFYFLPPGERYYHPEFQAGKCVPIIGPKIAAAIAAAGEDWIPGVRGKNKQAVVAILHDALGDERKALACLDALRPYLK